MFSWVPLSEHCSSLSSYARESLKPVDSVKELSLATIASMVLRTSEAVPSHTLAASQDILRNYRVLQSCPRVYRWAEAFGSHPLLQNGRRLHHRHQSQYKSYPLVHTCTSIILCSSLPRTGRNSSRCPQCPQSGVMMSRPCQLALSPHWKSRRGGSVSH